MFPMMPYSDLYTLNLDWVIKAATEAKKATENIAAFAGVDAVAHTANEASVDLDIIDNHYRFTFGLPRGIQGAPGVNGEDGERGSSLFVGQQITGHTDGQPFSGPDDDYDYLYNDVYINSSTGEMYRCSQVGTGTTSKWRYMFTLNIGEQQQPKTTFEIISLNLPSEAVPIAANGKTSRQTLGTISVPARTVAIPIYFNTLHWYVSLSGLRIGTQSAVNYEYFVNDTDNTTTTTISGLVLNLSNDPVSALDMARMSFMLVPIANFEQYQATISMQMMATSGIVNKENIATFEKVIYED